MNTLDQFFKQNLDGQTTAPSSEAWPELESSLIKEKRNSSVIWFKLAASVTLLLAITWLVKDMNQSSIQEKVPSYVQSSDREMLSTLSLSKKVLAQEDLSTTPPIRDQIIVVDNLELSTSSKYSIALFDKQPQITEVNPIITEANETVVKTNVAIAHKNHHSNRKIKNAPQDPAQEVALPKITIIYKRSKVSHVASAQASDSQSPKKKGLKKLFNKARNFQEEQLTLEQLRDAKDQLLAFNWKKKEK